MFQSVYIVFFWPLQLLLLSDYYTLCGSKEKMLQEIQSAKHWEERAITDVTAGCWRRDPSARKAWLDFHQSRVEDTSERLGCVVKYSQFKLWEYFQLKFPSKGPHVQTLGCCLKYQHRCLKWLRPPGPPRGNMVMWRWQSIRARWHS